MPAPITADGQVTYADGTQATVDQMSKDVSAFLLWTAEPNLQGRHKGGWAVLAFLIIATILGYMSYRNIWAEAKRKVAPKGALDPELKVKRTRASKKAGIAG
jgi:ubiquinol-cytochrome c reductase cytochrome c1 subunit